MWARFNIDGVEYEILRITANDWYKNDLPVRLPDGTFVRVSYWLESYPPIPQSFKEVRRPYGQIQAGVDYYYASYAPG